MKKFISILLLFTLLLSFTACGNIQKESTSEQNPHTTENLDPAQSTSSETAGKVLVAYFSRTGENYGVGTIEKGNTQIVAEIIADELGNADLFEIATVTPYPESYDETTEIAKKEQEQDIRPELTATVDNFDDYDTVFIGYPIWYGDMPMAVYTFLESYDFSGKTVIPFCTHAGSGLSSTEQTLRKKLPDADVLLGLAIKGTDVQNNKTSIEPTIKDWLTEVY